MFWRALFGNLCALFFWSHLLIIKRISSSNNRLPIGSVIFVRFRPIGFYRRDSQRHLLSLKINSEPVKNSQKPLESLSLYRETRLFKNEWNEKIWRRFQVVKILNHWKVSSFVRPIPRIRKYTFNQGTKVSWTKCASTRPQSAVMSETRPYITGW